MVSKDKKLTRSQRLTRTKEWREIIRPKLVGDKCEWCGSDTPPFNVHHLIKYTEKEDIPFDIISIIEKDIRTKAAELLKRLVDAGKIPRECYKIKEKPTCLKCKGISLLERKSLSKYYCQTCKIRYANVGETRVIATVPSEESLKKLGESRNLLGEILKEFVEDFTEEWDKKFDEEFLSGRDTVTLCKGCHKSYEIDKRKLCQKCKKKYHNSKYKYCYGCWDKQLKEKKILVSAIERRRYLSGYTYDFDEVIRIIESVSRST